MKMSLIKLIMLLVILLSNNVSSFIQDEEDCVPVTVYPVEYELTIIPYGDQYRGEVIIRIVSTVSGINYLTLDCQKLKITEVSLTRDSRNLIDQNKPFTVDNWKNKLHIYLRESIVASTVADHVLRITFDGNINKLGDSGFFMKSYYESDTLNGYTTTRNTPKFASTIFPCFDEPQIRSVYRLRIYRPRDNYQHSIALTPLQKEPIVQSRYEVCDYLPTPQIAPHQLCFLLSNFQRNQLTNPNIVLWTSRQDVSYSQSTLAITESLVRSMYNHIGEDNIATINIAALPNYDKSYERGSFSLINVGATKVLSNPIYSSAKQMERAEFELARQLCRIWLGNPITNTRWREQWLKEGLATYYAYYFLAKSNSQYGDYEKYSELLTIEAMKLDQADCSKPLTSFDNMTEVTILSDYEEKLISTKTASLFRMIEGWIGSEVFHRVMADFFKMMRGKYITLNNLGQHLQEKSLHCDFFNGSTVNDVLAGWIHLPKYPVVYADVFRQLNFVSLTQKQYTYSHQSHMSSSFRIPISYTTQYKDDCFNCLSPRFTIGAQEVWSFKEKLNGGWIIMNTNASGYYRVNYDKESWSLIAKTLNSPERTSIDRRNRAQYMSETKSALLEFVVLSSRDSCMCAEGKVEVIHKCYVNRKAAPGHKVNTKVYNLINDVFHMYLSGDVDMNTVKWILNGLEKETDQLVWSAAIEGFTAISKDQSKISNAEYLVWKNYMQTQVKPIYSKLKDSNQKESLEKRLFRASIVKFACSLEFEPCLEDMRQQFNNLIHTEIDPDIRETVISVAFKDANRRHLLEDYVRRCDAYARQEYYETIARLISMEKIHRPNIPFEEQPYLRPEDYKQECKASCPLIRENTTITTSDSIKHRSYAALFILNIFILLKFL